VVNPAPTSCHVSLQVCPLTLPTSLRVMKDPLFEVLLTTMDSILSHSTLLLRSATALSHSLIRGQAPAKILRLEIDDTLLDPDTVYSRQDLDGLLEPCSISTSLEDNYQDTLQVRGSFDSLAMRPPLSPIRSIQVSPLWQIHLADRPSLETLTTSVAGSVSPAKRGISTVCSQLGSPSHSSVRSGPISASLQSPWSDFTSLRSPAASFSDLLSPGKCGISSVPSNLRSPTRFPTPAAFNNAWVATDLRTPSLVSPVW